jgi:hypothetical protein
LVFLAGKGDVLLLNLHNQDHPGVPRQEEFLFGSVKGCSVWMAE